MMRDTPQANILPMQANALLRPMLPGVELRPNAPSYNNEYTMQMLDVLDRPSFINPRQTKLNKDSKETAKRVDALPEGTTQVRTGAPSVVTPVGPSVSKVREEPPLINPRVNVYEVHDCRFQKGREKVEQKGGQAFTNQQVSICSTPKIIVL